MQMYNKYAHDLLYNSHCWYNPDSRVSISVTTYVFFAWCDNKKNPTVCDVCPSTSLVHVLPCFLIFRDKISTSAEFNAPGKESIVYCPGINSFGTLRGLETMEPTDTKAFFEMKWWKHEQWVWINYFLGGGLQCRYFKKMDCLFFELKA